MNTESPGSSSSSTTTTIAAVAQTARSNCCLPKMLGNSFCCCNHKELALSLANAEPTDQTVGLTETAPPNSFPGAASAAVNTCGGATSVGPEGVGPGDGTGAVSGTGTSGTNPVTASTRHPQWVWAPPSQRPFESSCCHHLKPTTMLW